MYIVLLNGHAGCLKTTLSYLIASNIGLAHISTSVMGDFKSNRNDPNFMILREIRYKKALDVLKLYLKLDISVVLDGNYPFKKLRQRVYDLGVQYNVDDIISITCICTEPKIIQNRFNFRLINSTVPDSKANLLTAYYGSVEEYETIENDNYKNEKVSMMIFDSGKFSIKMIHSNSEMSIKIFNFINHLIEKKLLTKPFFIV